MNIHSDIQLSKWIIEELVDSNTTIAYDSDTYEYWVVQLTYDAEDQVVNITPIELA